MPGSRLTHEEREAIATGLRHRLGYAEIARRLRRPTSTVSREVGRNGGRGGYRAGRAEQGTRERARRVLPRAAPPAGTDDPAVRAFEERFTAMMIATGLPRMPSGVLVGLLTSPDGSLSAADLGRSLRASPASISKAVAYLERLQLVRRERVAGERRERYLVDDDVWSRACVREARVCTAWAGAARHGAQVLGETPAGARLGEMGRYFEQVGHALARTAAQWRHVSSAHRRARPAG